MIVLVVHYNVRPGTEGQAVEYIRKMQEHTRREPGCRLYFGHYSKSTTRGASFSTSSTTAVQRSTPTAPHPTRAEHNQRLGQAGGEHQSRVIRTC
jgi:hypothetical protein